ncbi:MAG TPA: pyridoxal 5'-phosphate synthase glutaminase subunit PdxT [Firmicutes bacterium]|nr:pyridoxal 5'-phosphate synthase glutaminase subunit PdxT [Bacillota bacterium]
MADQVRIGVLDLQGAVREHLRMVAALGCEAVPVKKVADLEGLQGLILPGGESTTLGKLMHRYGLDEAIKERAEAGMPIYGTCAGLILLAKHIPGSDQLRLGLMDVTVKRNAYGRQVDSFETDLDIPAVGPEPFRAVFIRAPYIESVGHGVEVLAAHAGHIVMARQGRFLVSAFHPELTDDRRVHAYFLERVAEVR